MESLNNRHFGTNINSSALSPVQRLSSLRYSNRIILIGGIKFGDLVLSIVERYLIQCPFLGVSSLRGSSLYNLMVSLNFQKPRSQLIIRVFLVFFFINIYLKKDNAINVNFVKLNI